MSPKIISLYHDTGFIPFSTFLPILFFFLPLPIYLSMYPSSPIYLNFFFPFLLQYGNALIVSLVFQTPIVDGYQSPVAGSSTCLLYLSNKITLRLFCRTPRPKGRGSATVKSSYESGCWAGSTALIPCLGLKYNY